MTPVMGVCCVKLRVLEGGVMLEYRALRVSEWFGLACDLAEAHRLETERDFSAGRADLDLAAYRVLEESGAAVAFGLFSDGALVGYVSGFVVRHLHYDFVVAQHDLLFVEPRFRKGRAALRLLGLFEEEARRRGAVRILYHAKPDSVFARLLERTGARCEEFVFCKGV
nr:MAG TPA: acetyltransferase [Caudoviricetes sp.]